MTDISLNHPARSGGFFANLISRVRAAQEARETRRALYALSDRELSDIGITRGDIEAIASGARV